MSPPKPKDPLPATGAAKSKFVQTCNRLSLFLKEKGNIRHLNFGINANFDATAAKASTVQPKSRPQYVILDSSCEVEDSTHIDDSLWKPKTAQMTIFYQGQVLALDDVPADRARDLMLMAKNGRPTVDQPSQSKSKSESESPVDVSGAKDSDLPIARRASLHKFLAKRKDRATIRQPYPHPHLLQNHSPGPGGSSSANDHSSFDLNM